MCARAEGRSACEMNRSQGGWCKRKGKHTGAEGSSACESCDAGTRSNASAASCTRCVAGRWSGTGDADCSECDAGKHSGPGASSCTLCRYVEGAPRRALRSPPSVLRLSTLPRRPTLEPVPIKPLKARRPAEIAVWGISQTPPALKNATSVDPRRSPARQARLLARRAPPQRPQRADLLGVTYGEAALERLQN